MNRTNLMKRVAVLLIAVMLACGLTPEAYPQKSSNAFTGNWVGGIDADGKWQFITVTFTGQEQIAGQLSVPLEGFTAKFSSVQIQGSSIKCELSVGAVKLLLTGALTQDKIEGVAEGSGRRGRFTLIRVAQVASATLAGYTGAYRFRDGRELVIDSFPGIPSTLVATDVQTGEVRALFPASETRFTGGPAMFVPYPAEQVISFRRRGALIRFKSDSLWPDAAT